MTRVLVLNGPNLGALLGRREPAVYGHATLAEVESALAQRAAECGVELRCAQSNHEGTLVDILEEERDRAQGCVINPGGLAHTSVVLRDALRAFDHPVVEVHITNVHAREAFRHTMLTAGAARAVVAGLGVHGYRVGLDAVLHLIDTGRTT